MKRTWIPSLILASLICALLLGAEENSKGVPFVMVNECERCAQAYFEPTFQFKAVSGTLPEHGSFYCRATRTELKCENDLTLVIERITFHDGAHGTH